MVDSNNGFERSVDWIRLRIPFHGYIHTCRCPTVGSICDGGNCYDVQDAMGWEGIVPRFRLRGMSYLNITEIGRVTADELHYHISPLPPQWSLHCGPVMAKRFQIPF